MLEGDQGSLGGGADSQLNQITRSEIRGLAEERERMGLVPVKGVFRQVTGNGTVSAVGDVTVAITVAARFMHTKNQRRDEHLPGPATWVCQILAAGATGSTDRARALGGRVDGGRQAGRPRSAIARSYSDRAGAAIMPRPSATCSTVAVASRDQSGRMHSGSADGSARRLPRSAHRVRLTSVDLSDG